VFVPHGRNLRAGAAKGPLGLSVIAARGQDQQLLDLVAGGLGELLRRA
jgi:hypothetical protein